MKLLQLHYFKILAENQHLTQTAEELFISPPALSATISRLEEELGVELFDRVGRNLVLNKNGQIFNKYVNDVFNSLNEAKAKLKEANALDRHTVNIAVSALTLWADAIAAYYKKNPDVSINQTTLKLDRLQKSEFINQFDLIITSKKDIQGNEWEDAVLVPDDKPVLVVYPNHPFSKLKNISMKEAKNENFIALTKGYSSRKYFDEMCEMAGFRPNIIVECDYSLRTQMVEDEYGITFSTVLGSKTPILKGLKFVQITEPINTRVQVVFWRRGHKLSDAAESFRNFIIEYYRSRYS